MTLAFSPSLLFPRFEPSPELPHATFINKFETTWLRPYLLPP